MLSKINSFKNSFIVGIEEYKGKIEINPSMSWNELFLKRFSFMSVYNNEHNE